MVVQQVTNYMQLLVPTQRLARMFQMTAVIMPCVLFVSRELEEKEQEAKRADGDYR